ncbi:hypothetical protein GALMADRAFT_133858 [Galerina marginata CBS 339.88]|uniref:Uncharacterized protein n=1 Tax=Galerina marginata (strain CBS 339.88) TaxID=685588 RepID=A0A067TZV2_GALM3|nr:hypothetical protein GALMADRAFT_133858 [Galerina marginata CBS 339.88]
MLISVSHHDHYHLLPSLPPSFKATKTRVACPSPRACGPALSEYGTVYCHSPRSNSTAPTPDFTRAQHRCPPRAPSLRRSSAPPALKSTPMRLALAPPPLPLSKVQADRRRILEPRNSATRPAPHPSLFQYRPLRIWGIAGTERYPQLPHVYVDGRRNSGGNQCQQDTGDEVGDEVGDGLGRGEGDETTSTRRRVG